MKFHKRQAYGINLTVVENSLLPPKGFAAINLVCVLTRDINDMTDNTLRHEAIHTMQAREMLYIFHFLLYGLEYLVKLCICRNTDMAYKSISTEQEAYYNSRNLNYRQERKWFAFARYIFKMYNPQKTRYD